MRMTRKDFELLTELKNLRRNGKKLSHAQIASVVGCKPSSVYYFCRFESFDEFEAHKKEQARRREVEKLTKQFATDTSHLPEEVVVETWVEPTLSEVIDRLKLLKEQIDSNHKDILKLLQPIGTPSHHTLSRFL